MIIAGREEQGLNNASKLFSLEELYYIPKSPFSCTHGPGTACSRQQETKEVCRIFVGHVKRELRTGNWN